MHATRLSRAGARVVRSAARSVLLRHSAVASRTLLSTRTAFICPIHRQSQNFTKSPQAASFSTSSSSPPSVDTAALLTPHLEPNSLLLELHHRGLLADVTNPQACVKWINTPAATSSPSSSSPSSSPSPLASFVPRVIYAGFDPTASSLHVGNLLVLMALRRFQQWGHKPICVVGGATGMIGDPSGRSTERNMLSEEQLQRNIDGITKDIQKFLRFDDSVNSAAINTSASNSNSSTSPVTTAAAPFNNGALLVNNLDWFRGQTLISFLRDTGRHFRLSQMLARDSVASRLHSDAGMSFTEFTYQTLQAYDFMHLHKALNVSLQIGGSDQWGNITAGVELIKREATAHQEPSSANKKLSEPQVFGLTLPLLTTASGQKFGKSMGNAPIWLSSDASSPNSSSPYQFYQYFFNSTADADLVRFLRLFTDLSLSEIQALEQEYLISGKPNGSRELAKKLAEEVTRIVHGEEGLKQAQQTTEMLFAKKSGADNGSATNSLSAEQFLQLFQGAPILNRSSNVLFTPAPKSIVDLCVEMGVTKTKAEARRLIAQGGLNLNDVKITNDAKLLEPTDLATKGSADTPSEQIKVAVFRSGKKKQFVLVVRD